MESGNGHHLGSLVSVGFLYSIFCSRRPAASLTARCVVVVVVVAMPVLDINSLIASRQRRDSFLLDQVASTDIDYVAEFQR